MNELKYMQVSMAAGRWFGLKLLHVVWRGTNQQDLIRNIII
jgi:hypothetical protein